MTNLIRNNTFERCGTAVKIVGDCDVEADGNNIIDCDKGFDIEAAAAPSSFVSDTASNAVGGLISSAVTGTFSSLFALDTYLR